MDQIPVPVDSLLRTYRASADPSAWDHYADCFVTKVQRPVSLTEYLLAFYDSLPFRLERLLIGVVAKRPSTIVHVRALASGSIQDFSAWTVLARTDTQILLGDFQNNTRSWLAVVPQGDATELRFGSAIRAVLDRNSGAPSMSWGFKALGSFHVFYSRVLLRAAARRLNTQG